MTAYTINSGAVVNFDTLASPSTNATLDTFNIRDGSTLLIDTDTFQCANHSSAGGSLDTVSFSTTGGVLRIDGTNVWIVPFESGTGTVPAIGQTVTQPGRTSTGEFLGVWESFQVAPTESGAAMPSAGWIKLRGFSGEDFAAAVAVEVNATAIATASGVQQRGWIEVRGANTATVTVPRVGRVEVAGDWLELGTTTGVRGQLLLCPSAEAADGIIPGVQIETAAGSGVYEWYRGNGTAPTNAATPTDSFRGKIVWQTTSGVRIGNDGVNDVGYLPPAGCRVRVPNVFLTCCVRTAGFGSGPSVLPNATLATRQEFVTTNAGEIILDKCVVFWYANFQQPFNTDIVDTAIATILAIGEQSESINIQNTIVGVTQQQLAIPLTLVSCFSGGTVNNSTFVRYSLANGGYAVSMSVVNNLTFNDCLLVSVLNRAHATSGAVTTIRTSDCVWHNTSVVGAGRFVHTTCARVRHTGVLKYSDTVTGTTTSALGMYICVLSNTEGVRWYADIEFPVDNTHPYLGLFNSAGANDTLFTGVGSYSDPLVLGTVATAGAIWISGGNNNNLRLKRIYVNNTRTGTWTTLNSDNNILYESCYGDYADTSQIATLNSRLRGCGGTAAVTGQASVYGTHWQSYFTSPTEGRVIISCNEPTDATDAECSQPTGSGKFTSTGQIILTSVDDSVTWTSTEPITGYTAFANTIVTVTGTNASNHTIEYRIDTGSGFNADWRTLYYTRTSGGGTSGSTTVTMSDTTGVQVGSSIFGTNIASGATVVSVDSGTAITVSSPNTGTVSGTLTFNRIPQESIPDPETGFLLQVRATCRVASLSNALTFVRIDMLTTDEIQGANNYPLEPINITLTGLKNPTEVRVYEAGTAISVAGSESVTTGTFAFAAESNQLLDIAILSLGYQNVRITEYSSSVSTSVPIQQQLDRQYLNP